MTNRLKNYSRLGDLLTTIAHMKINSERPRNNHKKIDDKYRKIEEKYMAELRESSKRSLFNYSCRPRFCVKCAQKTTNYIIFLNTQT